MNLYCFYLPSSIKRAEPKIRRQQKKKKSLAGESVGEVRCAGSKPAFSCRPATISFKTPPTPLTLCVLHTAYFHLQHTVDRTPYHFKANTRNSLLTFLLHLRCCPSARPEQHQTNMMTDLDQSTLVVEPGACGHWASVRSACLLCVKVYRGWQENKVVYDHICLNKTECAYRWKSSQWGHPLVCKYPFWTLRVSFIFSVILMFWNHDSMFECVGGTQRWEAQKYKYIFRMRLLFINIF